jgi:hypothetical protein
LNQFENAMASDGFADPANGYATWLDVPAAVDFALFQELARNTDGYTKSSYYQKPPDSEGGKLTAGPIWDNDLSFGIFANGTEDPEGWQYQFNWNNPVPWWPRLHGDPTFQNLVRCRWQSLRTGGLTAEHIAQKLDEFATILSKAQPREDARWQLIGRGRTISLT